MLLFLVFFIPLCNSRYTPIIISFHLRDCLLTFVTIRFAGDEFFQFLNIWKKLYFAFVFETFLLSIEFCGNSFFLHVLRILLVCLLACIVSYEKSYRKDLSLFFHVLSFFPPMYCLFSL